MRARLSLSCSVLARLGKKKTCLGRKCFGVIRGEDRRVSYRGCGKRHGDKVREKNELVSTRS